MHLEDRAGGDIKGKLKRCRIRRRGDQRKTNRVAGRVEQRRSVERVKHALATPTRVLLIMTNAEGLLRRRVTRLHQPVLGSVRALLAEPNEPIESHGIHCVG